MKNRPCPKFIIVICIILFTSWSCIAESAMFPPTPTPPPTFTQTSTLTPSPTSTLTPTVTPTSTPAPEFVLAALQASDFPPGAVAVPPPVESDPNTRWFSYALHDEIFFGFTSPFNSGDEIANFDTIMNNPRLLSSFLALEFSKATVKNVMLHPGLDDFPDRSNGFTAQILVGTDTFDADIFMIRKGRVGSLVVGFYLDSATPSMSLKDLAIMVSNRMSQAVQ
jgi:hypothetical protein